MQSSLIPLCMVMQTLEWPIIRSLLQIGILFSCCSFAARADDGIDFFETKVRPVFVKHCYACHSAEAARKRMLKGNLHLDTRAGIRRGGSSGPAVVPGKVADSLLISALRQESFEMPPTGKLPEATIADIIKWVEIGAPDPRDAPQHSAATSRVPVQAGQHWAFQPPRMPPPPDVRNTSWPLGEIDRFILGRLEKEGLQPAKRVDKRTLIRRAAYDLVGLPPTLEQSSSFLNSDDPTAFAKVVDLLLDSPHFGVHWARFWLDNVRYTQDDYTCCAFATNQFDPTPYRDWVVRALNTDLPYDDFVRLQIAGDLIPHQDPAKLNADGMTATGLWTFPHIIADNDPDKVIVDFVDQQIDVLGRTFLGLTLACARCHDHKFDPIPQRDYYALAGIFLSSHSLTHVHPDTGDASRARAAYRVLMPVFTTRQQQLDYDRRMSRIEKLQTQIKQLKQRHSISFDLRTVRNRIKQQMQRKVESAVEEQDRDSKLARFKLRESELLAKIDPAIWERQTDTLFAQHDRLTEQVKQIQEPINDLPRRPVLIEGGSPGTRYGGKIGDVPVFIRGTHTQDGELAPRAFPAVLCWRDERLIADRTHGSGRRELAEWLVNPRHPLTARVIVNRVWQQLFGYGLVRTPSNFGRLGSRPTHPPLLDYLALRFSTPSRSPLSKGDTRGLGWSLKGLLRELILSATYQQESRVSLEQWRADPENLLLSRMNRKRLSGEQLRDTLQLFAGKLRRANVANRLRDSGRALYLKITRFEEPDDLLSLFDVPDPSLLVPNRSESTSSTQALFMLNNPIVVDVAKQWAERLRAHKASDHDTLDRAFRELYGRSPTDEQRNVASETLTTFRGQWRQTMTGDGSTKEHKCDARAWQDLCHVLLCGNELMYAD